MGGVVFVLEGLEVFHEGLLEKFLLYHIGPIVHTHKYKPTPAPKPRAHRQHRPNPLDINPSLPSVQPIEQIKQMFFFLISQRHCISFHGTEIDYMEESLKFGAWNLRDFCWVVGGMVKHGFLIGCYILFIALF